MTPMENFYESNTNLLKSVHCMFTTFDMPLPNMQCKFLHRGPFQLHTKKPSLMRVGSPCCRM